MSKKSTATSTKPSSSNWLALQKTLPKPSRKRERDSEDVPRKRRKIERDDSVSKPPPPPPSVTRDSGRADLGSDEVKNGESLVALRRMILGQMEYTEAQQLPGKYLALDCEMVGVGPEGTESVLARVSLVNFHGAVLLDAFVRPKERVVDYRTEWSGVRERDMVNARPFVEVQSQVSELIKDRILIGHALFNDLKALLLDHPRPLTRDTQSYAGRFKVSKSKYVALRNLVQQEVGVTIQGGEHSSVTDARATMAVYRLHRREWEKGSVGLRGMAASMKGKGKQLAGQEDEDGGEESGNDDDDDEPALPMKKRLKNDQRDKKRDGFPGGGRKGVSSGLGVIVRRASGVADAGGGKEKIESGRTQTKTKTAWWKELGDGGGKKGSMRL
ncbi:ribonuclease H-like domain-containing protein [Roridomyces roridus]|uniref:RNA exonuclease 4 n=1 Tax=Roridomyces roridus TaxID=1738132 RepID=A0AAD7FLS4_9AGAR|nr:ribonuclease H-like domain-containing protein [Roridomyces roridus]